MAITQTGAKSQPIKGMKLKKNPKMAFENETAAAALVSFSMTIPS